VSRLRNLLTILPILWLLLVSSAWAADVSPDRGSTNDSCRPGKDRPLVCLDQGKRVDDSRSYLESLPPSGEGPWQEAYGQGSFLAGKAGDPRSAACSGAAPASANDLPFRITVDGEPVVGDTLKPEPDRQRCVDVALAKNEIQVRYDPLQAKPALNT
jgi:hypothetical protein